MTAVAVAEERAELIEAREFVHPPRPFIWQDYVVEASYALGTIAVLALVAWLVVRIIKRGPTPKRRALRAFRRAGHLREDRGPLWFTLRCNRILRDFFQNVFSINAAAQTSREFLEGVLRLNVLDDEQQAWLEEYLARCDEIRFSAGKSDTETLDRFYEAAIALVKSVYRRQKSNPALVPEPELVSPFLPGTPIPDPEEAERERDREAAEREAAEAAASARTTNQKGKA